MTVAEKLKKIADNEQQVYNTGVDKGREYGRNGVMATIQHGGSRLDYSYAFYSSGYNEGYKWNDTNFVPLYDFCYHEVTYDEPVSAAVNMFAGAQITDLKGILERLGIQWYVCGDMEYMFASSTVTRVPALDSITNGDGIFLYATELKSVDKFEVGSDNTTLDRAFEGAYNLQDIAVEGIIGCDVKLWWSGYLSKASVTSFISALSDTVTGKTIGFAEKCVKNLYGDDFVSNSEWNNLIASKPNWTVEILPGRAQ